MENLLFLFNTWMKFMFLFMPFFALTMFLSATEDYSNEKRNGLAMHVVLAVAGLCIGLLFFGDIVFALFGITLDAFRVGAGALLFISAIPLVQGKRGSLSVKDDEDVAIVPLAMPVVVGPATIGALLVLGGDISGITQRVLGCVAVVMASAVLWVILRMGTSIKNRVGGRGLRVMARITGLVLSALAAQMVMMGIKNYFES